MSDDESAVSPVGQTWHSDLVGQPHSAAEEKVAEAEAVAARISTEDVPRGSLGPRFNWRSPFMIGMTATGGAAITFGVGMNPMSFVQAARSIAVITTQARRCWLEKSWQEKFRNPRPSPGGSGPPPGAISGSEDEIDLKDRRGWQSRAQAGTLRGDPHGRWWW